MLVCVGDLLENILVVLPSVPSGGFDNRVRSARVRGGSAANVAALDAEKGGTPRFVGQIGDDTLGRTLTDDLERRGVELVVHSEGATGVILTMIGRTGRTLLTDRGTARHLFAIEPSVLDNASQIYLAASAFVADPMATAVDRLLGDARAKQLDLFIGGPNEADRQDFGTDAFLELVSVASPAAVFLNRGEHQELGLKDQQCIPGAKMTIVTDHSHPTLVLRANGSAETVEVPPVTQIRDRTGVGDGFIAGYLASIRAGADPVSATHAGHRTAARVLAQLGPTTRPD